MTIFSLKIDLGITEGLVVVEVVKVYGIGHKLIY